jgi:hypothetical protein
LFPYYFFELEVLRRQEEILSRAGRLRLRPWAPVRDRHRTATLALLAARWLHGLGDRLESHAAARESR